MIMIILNRVDTPLLTIDTLFPDCVWILHDLIPNLCYNLYFYTGTHVTEVICVFEVYLDPNTYWDLKRGLGSPNVY